MTLICAHSGDQLSVLAPGRRGADPEREWRLG
jgi:hypothetical protein